MNNKHLETLNNGAQGGAAPSNGALKTPPDIKANILLVDDRPDKLLALDAIIGSLGQNVVQVRSGKEALRALLKQDFAVILLDVSMPGMDGFETASLIRKRPRSEHTPIIFITSIGNSENHISQGYSIGAVDYMLTPIVPQILRTKVSVFVELHKKTELIKSQAEQLRRAEESKHQRELAEFADRLEAETRRNRFFTLALEMLGIADLDGRLLQVNSAWEKVLGYSEAELKGFAGPEITHPEERDNLLAGMAALKNGLPLPGFEGRFRHKDGSYRWLAGTAVPFLEEKLVYIFARDITPRKQAEDQIGSLNRELEHRVVALTEANRELEAFNYSIAHDLRAPLRSMSGFAQALLEDEADKMSPEAADYAARISRSAKYMDTLLRDLLAYSRLAREEMPPQNIDLEEPIHELLTVLEPEIRERGAQIEVVSPLGTIIAHSPTLKQIISNLIGNSLKFLSPDRPPKLRIHSTTQNGAVRLWIEDNGIGIASEHHEKIFRLFQRLHDAQAYPGTGIGLALVRKGAERMGGHAGVESIPGQGSRFWVEFVAAPGPAKEPRALLADAASVIRAPGAAKNA
jgi:PAS domain S-box-containing protein